MRHYQRYTFDHNVLIPLTFSFPSVVTLQFRLTWYQLRLKIRIVTLSKSEFYNCCRWNCRQLWIYTQHRTFIDVHTTYPYLRVNEPDWFSFDKHCKNPRFPMDRTSTRVTQTLFNYIPNKRTSSRKQAGLNRQRWSTSSRHTFTSIVSLVPLAQVPVMNERLTSFSKTI